MRRKLLPHHSHILFVHAKPAIRTHRDTPLHQSAPRCTLQRARRPHAPLSSSSLNLPTALFASNKSPVHVTNAVLSPFCPLRFALAHSFAPMLSFRERFIPSDAPSLQFVQQFLLLQHLYCGITCCNIDLRKRRLQRACGSRTGSCVRDAAAPPPACHRLTGRHALHHADIFQALLGPVLDALSPNTSPRNRACAGYHPLQLHSKRLTGVDWTPQSLQAPGARSRSPPPPNDVAAHGTSAAQVPCCPPTRASVPRSHIEPPPLLVAAPAPDRRDKLLQLRERPLHVPGAVYARAAST